MNIGDFIAAWFVIWTLIAPPIALVAWIVEKIEHNLNNKHSKKRIRNGKNKNRKTGAYWVRKSGVCAKFTEATSFRVYATPKRVGRG
jgi:hypothetical protein